MPRQDAPEALSHPVRRQPQRRRARQRDVRSPEQRAQSLLPTRHFFPRGWRGETPRVTGGGRMLGGSWAGCIQGPGTRLEHVACLWADEWHPCPAPPHHGVAPRGVVRVDARWGRGHDALPPAAFALDHLLDARAPALIDSHPAPGQGRAPGRLDAQIAIVAPAARGFVAGHALEEAAIALPGQPLDKARMGIRVVEI
jgi:hypothetical protein